MESYKTSSFLPPSSSFQLVLGDVQHMKTRNLFQIHREALKSLAHRLTSSSSLQNLIKTRPRDHTWSTKLLDFKHKVLKDFWKTNLNQIFTEGTFGKNSTCSIFYLFYLIFTFTDINILLPTKPFLNTCLPFLDSYHLAWTLGRRFLQKGCSDIGMGCPGRQWSHCPWRYLRKDWVWYSAPQSVGKDTGWTWSQRPFPTHLILWFCDMHQKTF